MSRTTPSQSVRPRFHRPRAGDLYVPTIGQVVEAKRSTARAYVRTAIGQALDYAAVARRHGLAVTPAVLLPSEPQPSMLELSTSIGITVWWPISSGDFREVRP